LNPHLPRQTSIHPHQSVSQFQPHSSS
jgi:hypothetical protein